MSDKKYEMHMQLLSNAYQVTQDSINMLSNQIPIDEDRLKISQQNLQYLSNKINTLIDERATNTNTDTKPARLIPVRLI